MSDDLPTHEFDMSIGIHDPKPYPAWCPAPSQIQAAAAVIRFQNEDRRWANAAGRESGRKSSDDA